MAGYDVEGEVRCGQCSKVIEEEDFYRCRKCIEDYCLACADKRSGRVYEDKKKAAEPELLYSLENLDKVERAGVIDYPVIID